jgi:hypothetical protein
VGGNQAAVELGGLHLADARLQLGDTIGARLGTALARYSAVSRYSTALARDSTVGCEGCGGHLSMFEHMFYCVNCRGHPIGVSRPNVTEDGA